MDGHFAPLALIPALAAYAQVSNMKKEIRTDRLGLGRLSEHTASAPAAIGCKSMSGE